MRDGSSVRRFSRPRTSTSRARWWRSCRRRSSARRRRRTTTPRARPHARGSASGRWPGWRVSCARRGGAGDAGPAGCSAWCARLSPAPRRSPTRCSPCRRWDRCRITLAGSDGAPSALAAARSRPASAMAAFAMTEPEAGSDVGRPGDARRGATATDYVLDGAKRFISNAGIADVYRVFASTEPDDGRRGLACFVVPAGDPAACASSGRRCCRAASARARSPSRAAASRLRRRLGEEGEGFELGMRTLDRLRPTVAAAACGMAARALEEALAHARARRQFGRPLADFQLVQAKLARMATELAAARLLTYRAAWEADLGAERVTHGARRWPSSSPPRRPSGWSTTPCRSWAAAASSRADRSTASTGRCARCGSTRGRREIQHLVIARQLLQSV